MSTTNASSPEEYGAATDRLTDSNVLKLWGIVVAAGWIVSQGAVATGAVPAVGLSAFWLVGSLVPITASFLWMRRRGFTSIFPVWTLLGVTGVVLSFATALEALAIDPVLIFGGLWFAGPAVGFLVTAAYMNDWSRRLYLAAAVANLIGAVVVVTVPAFQSFYYIAAAITQGLPMLYHGVALD